MTSSFFKVYIVILLLFTSSVACWAKNNANDQEKPKKIPTPYEKAIAAFGENDTATAMMILLPLAEAGDPQSQFIVASNYQKKNDIKNAMSWYRKAAKQGHMQAQTTLGLLYIDGKYMERKPKLAAKYLLMATRNQQALSDPKKEQSKKSKKKTEKDTEKVEPTDYEKGIAAYKKKDYFSALKYWLPLSDKRNNEADYMIGKLLLDKELGPVDGSKAAFWFKRAADNNHLESQTQLGLMYLNGDLIKRDLIVASNWLLEATQNKSLASLNDGENGIVKDAKKKDKNKDKKKSAKQLQLEYEELFNKGLRAYGRKDYEKAIMHLYPLALKDDDEAQLVLGDIYVREEGVYKDVKKGLDWYERAIAQDNIKAARTLGLMYLNGDFVKQDSKKAVSLLLKAARLGDVESQLTLGNYYISSKKTDYNPSKGAYWLEKAAKKKDPDAQYTLAELYMTGVGVEENEKKALKLYKKADKQGHQKASLILGKKLYLDDKKPDYKQAFELFKRSANQGEAEASYYLAEMYFNGQATTKDIKLAFNWYSKSASLGYSDAAYKLGKIYVNGYGVKKNFKKGFEYFLQAAEKGHGAAQNEVGVAYYSNQGVDRDVLTAYAWFYLASQKKVANANENRKIIYKYFSKEEKKEANALVAKFKKLYR